MPKGGRREEHSFYCINCGKRAMSLQRPVSKLREAHHRKKLYCPCCGNVVNCIECRNDSEVYEFKENFELGVYKEEAEASLKECKGE